MLIIKKIESDLPEGRWFTYSEGVEFQVRPLTGEVLRRLRKQVTTTKMEVDPGSRRMVPVEKVNDEKLEEVMTDYLIQDFKGIGISSDRAMEVSLENKKLIMDQIPLREFIWASAQSLDVGQEQIKNS